MLRELKLQVCENKGNSLEQGKKVQNWNNNNKNEVLFVTCKMYCIPSSIAHIFQVMCKTTMCEIGVASKWCNMCTRFCENQPLVSEIVRGGTQAALSSHKSSFSMSKESRPVKINFGTK